MASISGRYPDTGGIAVMEYDLVDNMADEKMQVRAL
jgi:hypothetical protein